jgi:hypothetical protein
MSFGMGGRVDIAAPNEIVKPHFGLELYCQGTAQESLITIYFVEKLGI